MDFSEKKGWKALFYAFFLIFWVSPIGAQDVHATWNRLLTTYVSPAGTVNYKGFLSEKKAVETYLTQLSQNVPLPTASKNEKLAFWINAYNAATVKLILDHYPLKSIMDLDGGKTWDVKRFTFGTKKYSLNDIENAIVRPLGDARIHFALNCAAKSCPPLHNQAFTTDNVEGLLQARTKAFINNKKRTVVTENALTLSKIFEWYASDFGTVSTFISRFSTVRVSPKAKISYFNYDWSLNE